MERLTKRYKYENVESDTKNINRERGKVMADANLGFDTLKVRGGYNPKEHNYAVSVPIYQTASFELGDTERVERLLSFSEFGFLYTRSLIINSPKTTHGELTLDELKFAGIPPETIRLSLGLEDADDLIADLEQALEKAFE